jgi:hypothetical protein
VDIVTTACESLSASSNFVSQESKMTTISIESESFSSIQEESTMESTSPSRSSNPIPEGSTITMRITESKLELTTLLK